MPHPSQGYRLKDGTKVPGTTTIIGRFKESGALLFWAFNQGKAAERGEIKSLYDKRDEAADAGTLAHELVDQHIHGKKPRLPGGTPEPIAQAALKAFAGYLKWAKMTRLKVVETEMQLVSEEYRFGGTPDAIGEIDGELCLLDWKTSKSVYADYIIQLGAYKHLWEENYPDRPLVGGCHLLRFSKSDTGDFAHHYFPDVEEGWRQFVLFREAYDIDKHLKRRAA